MNPALRLVLLLAVLAVSGRAPAAENARALIARLDSVLAGVEQLHAHKEIRIRALRESLAASRNAEDRITACLDLYREYEVYQFDSAFAYVERAVNLSVAAGIRYRIDESRICKARLLSIGGLYPEAVAELDSIDYATLAPPLRFDYVMANFYTYLYWSDYCGEQVYAPRYREQAISWMRRAYPLIDRSRPEGAYFLGEYYVYVHPDSRKARACYLQAVRRLPKDSRVYAMATYAVANNYSAAGDMDKYEHYLLLSCISDIVCCTRDNMALPDLAMYLYNGQHADVQRAELYIAAAMTAAKRYNNRLRILEISQKLPLIVDAYKQTVTRQNMVLRVASTVAVVLMIAAMLLLYFYVRQNRQLSSKRRELSGSNAQLHTLNDRLHTLNDRLLSTNVRRERLAKLYIDLCADYIDRLSRFELLVRRKIKAGQIQDLLSMASSSRLSEQDAATFLVQFDRAFLDLYPTFADELNALLRPECRVETPSDARLTTEQRIFALIRLGVKDSAEIAALLFYTPRTIYNYRSAFKNRAIDRDAFEDNVARLCTVI